MMFAVIDIETTGGRVEKDRITEIAIILYNGDKIIESYSTLINPGCKIPYNITQLTGISDSMVSQAPLFYEVAKRIIELTENTVFVAHNVRFDYGFIKAEFKNLGYNFHRETLCTVRLSRATFKGLPSYSLGNLCQSLNINIENRHRALGDANATVIILNKIFEKNKHENPNWVYQETKKTSIPPLLNENILANIPEQIIGVYYFHNAQGNVIYIGKSIDIKKRILQHFALTAKGSPYAIKLKNEIADIIFQCTGNELIALLLESDEIKKLKPMYNIMQKRTKTIPYYGIFKQYDAFGYISFYIKKLKESDEPIFTADNMTLVKAELYKIIEKYNLCPSKCDMHQMGSACFYYQLHQCKGSCKGEENFEPYNIRALEAIKYSSFQNESFIIVSKGRQTYEKSIVMIEKGQYKGFGFIDVSHNEPSIEDMCQSVKKYAHNRDIQKILCTYINSKQHTKIKI